MSSSAVSFSLNTPVAALRSGAVAGWLRELHRRNPVLSLTGWGHVVLLLVALVLLPLDARLVTGAPVWLKPLKFTVSITAYVWALGWLLADLPVRPSGQCGGLAGEWR